MNIRINHSSVHILPVNNVQNMAKKATNGLRQSNPNDDLRLSVLAGSMTQRLEEHGIAVSKWSNSVMQNDNRLAVKPLKFVDKAISNIGKTLEEMKTLSMMGQNKDLSDEDRIDLQIQMVKLQSQLFKDTHRMSLEAAGKTYSHIEQSMSLQINEGEELLIAMMENVKKRIAEGEYTPREDGIDLSEFTFTKFTHFLDPETGETTRTGIASRLFFKGRIEDLGLEASLLEDIDVASSGATFLGALVINTSFAEASTERIQKQIDGLSKFKEDFVKFYNNVPDEGYDDRGEELEFNQGDGIQTTAAGVFSVFTKGELLNGGESEEQFHSGIDCDYRISKPRNPMDAFLQRADHTFKDLIYKSLGFTIGKFDIGKISDHAANSSSVKPHPRSVGIEAQHSVAPSTPSRYSRNYPQNKNTYI